MNTIHQTLLLVITLILVVCLLVMAGKRLGVSYPIFLVITGLLLSFIPGLPVITINPDLVFLVFLPPLLYEAAWFTSWKEFWKWRRVVITLAFGLVILTSCVVAFISWQLIPGFTLALGFLLGGIISPPDAVAATTVLKNVRIPKRLISMLEGESLVNDASSLIVFRFALAAVISGQFVFRQAAIDFVLVTVMGIAIGIGIAVIVYFFYRKLPTTPNIDTTLSFAAPYLMYLAAEAFHFSGVMAVVSGGLFLSFRSHRMLSHASRMQSLGMWSTVTFVLNGLIFILIGLELPVILNGMEGYSFKEALKYALLITLAVIVTRILVTLFMSVFTRFISRFIRTNDPNPGWRNPFIIGWTGMRGVVSLAAALSIPLVMPGGEAFPHRNLILFISFTVIMITLVAQGLTLPIVIRLVHPRDPEPSLPDHEQEATIRQHLANIAMKRLDERYGKQLDENPEVKLLREKISKEFDQVEDLRKYNGNNKVGKESMDEFLRVLTDIYRLKREELHNLRKREGIEEEMIRKMEARLDLEELRHRQNAE